MESAFCGMPPLIEMPVFEISFLVFFFIPMILIIYFYGRMGAKIRSTTTQQLGEFLFLVKHFIFANDFDYVNKIFYLNFSLFPGVQQGSMQRESRHQQSRKAVIRMLGGYIYYYDISILYLNKIIIYFWK